MLKSRKSQQEAVGFIIIILIVVIAGVIFLGISLRKPVEKITDPEIANFLSASLKHTSECAKNYEPNYLSMAELSYSCYNSNMECLNKEKSCAMLNKTYGEMVKRFKPAGGLNHYKMSFKYMAEMNDSGYEFMKIESNAGKCKSIISGRALESLGSRGYLSIELEICPV